MSTAKQVTSCAIRLFIYNGFRDTNGNRLYRAYSAGAIQYNIWNMQFEYIAEFLGSASQRTLSGYERGGVLGYRPKCSINLNNSLPSDTTKIRELLSNLSSWTNSDRTFQSAVNVAVSANGSNQITLGATGVAIADFYTGLEVINQTTFERRVVTGYTAGKVLTMSSSIPTSWAGQNVRFRVPPNIPTIIGLSPDSNEANIVYFNLDGSILGMQREFTINSSVIQMSLKGVDVVPIIPTSAQI
jgi:hypothetical protein